MIESPLVFERQIKAKDNSKTAIEILATDCPEVSKQKLKLAMKYGAVWCSEPSSINKPQRLRRAKRIIAKGSILYLYYNQQVLFNPVNPAELISDQGSYSVWNKPSGMFSQGTKWGDHTSIGRWIELFGYELENIRQRETYLVHRLDRATNGLILVAHTKRMAQKLTRLFEARKIKKQYCAVVDGQFPIDKFPKFDDLIDERKAITDILSVDYCNNNQQSILLIGLETGRKHQIRKHLAAAGFPVKNDYLYGESQVSSQEKPNEPQIVVPQRCLLLRSHLLEFLCPNNNEVVRFELSSYTKESFKSL